MAALNCICIYFVPQWLVRVISKSKLIIYVANDLALFCVLNYTSKSHFFQSIEQCLVTLPNAALRNGYSSRKGLFSISNLTMKIE